MKTFLEAMMELKSNLGDYMDRQNCHIPAVYFGNVNFADPENWKEFIRAIKSFNSFNGGKTWMHSFWHLLNSYGLFDNEEFLVAYLNAIDSSSSVETAGDPFDTRTFTLFIKKGTFDRIKSRIPQEVADHLEKYGRFS